MNAKGKRSAWLLAAAFVLIDLGAGGVCADPSEPCRNLAIRFGSQPSTLDTGSLAALSTCVTDEIQVRAASASPVAPSGPQRSDSTSEGQPAPQADGTWGTWPTTPAWKDQEIQSTPWDGYDK